MKKLALLFAGIILFLLSFVFIYLGFYYMRPTAANLFIISLGFVMFILGALLMLEEIKILNKNEKSN